MTNILSRISARRRLTDRFPHAARRRKRLVIESLEHRLALSASPPLYFAPRAIVEVNPGPVPPVALVAFDPQPVLHNLVPPGPVQIVGPRYSVVGSFSDIQQITRGPSSTAGAVNTTVSARVTVSYFLQAQVNETITPPPLAGSSGNTNGAVSANYSLWGLVTVQVVIPAGITAQPGVGPQTTLSYRSVSTQAAPYAMGTVTAAIAPIDATGFNQAINFNTNATINENFSGIVTQTLGGLSTVQAVTLVRGAAQDNSLANWVETLHAGAASSSVVTSIAANYKSNDTLAESLWVGPTPASTTAPTYQISATDAASGSLTENVNPGPVAASIAAPLIVVTGMSHTRDSLAGTINVGPPGSEAPTLLLNEQAMGVGTFTSTLITLSALPPLPILTGLGQPLSAAM